jgi:hypothetical protein
LHPVEKARRGRGTLTAAFYLSLARVVYNPHYSWTLTS